MVCLQLSESNLNSTMSLLREDILSAMRHLVCTYIASCSIWIPSMRLSPVKGAISSEHTNATALHPLHAR